MPGKPRRIGGSSAPPRTVWNGRHLRRRMRSGSRVARTWPSIREAASPAPHGLAPVHAAGHLPAATASSRSAPGEIPLSVRVWMVHDPSPLKVHEDRAARFLLPPSPVADRKRRPSTRPRSSPPAGSPGWGARCGIGRRSRGPCARERGTTPDDSECGLRLVEAVPVRPVARLHRGTNARTHQGRVGAVRGAGRSSPTHVHASGHAEPRVLRPARLEKRPAREARTVTEQPFSLVDSHLHLDMPEFDADRDDGRGPRA